MTEDGKTAGGAGARVGERGVAGVDVGSATMREIGGSSSDAFNMLIVRQTAAALPVNPESDADRRTQAEAALAGLMGIAPRGEIEGMLAAQLVACHNAAMACFRQAAHPAQPSEVRAENLALGGRLSRASAALVEALDRRRGDGGPKTVTVEHRVIRGEPGLEARAVPRLSAPRAAPSHTAPPQKGNGHALNGHKSLNGREASGGAALP